MGEGLRRMKPRDLEHIAPVKTKSVTQQIHQEGYMETWRHKQTKGIPLKKQ